MNATIFDESNRMFEVEPMAAVFNHLGKKVGEVPVPTEWTGSRLRPDVPTTCYGRSVVDFQYSFSLPKGTAKMHIFLDR